ncbi:cell division topological specificity factor MinE [uncultured Paracoccus sp.]|uniref:cell division topological specificity factor MinE n=1 Tax=uncultured Paracoccus sp. TaxID=189685 RepID=UPI0025CBE25A|nr:cell division topological specificity factor MinE [uncultured Paracoccus sp.]
MFGFLRSRKPSSAQTAKERLQILLAHERGSGGGSDPDFLASLQRDILEVVRRHIEIDRDAVEIKLERSDDLSSLEINIDMPGAKARTPG